MLSHDATRPSHGEDVAPVTIVVGIDGTDSSLRALAYAVGTARRASGRLIVAYACNPFNASTAALGLSTGYGPVILEAAAEAADSVLAQLQPLVDRIERETGVAVELACVPGDPARALAQLATDTRADLVIVGTSHRIAHRLFGSVSRRLSRSARWPLTVVP